MGYYRKRYRKYKKRYQKDLNKCLILVYSKMRTMIPLKLSTRKKLKKICEIEGRNYDVMLNIMIDMYSHMAKIEV